jgi:hypothetical protein
MPFPADIPPAIHERVVCAIEAAVRYQIPANLMLALAEMEGGKAGQWVRNNNGTYDVGAMQFNTSYLSDLKEYGITPEAVAAAGCYPFQLAAWRVRQHILHDPGDLWTKAANYHSRTPQYNSRYRLKLVTLSIKWADWLDAHFHTARYKGR